MWEQIRANRRRSVVLVIVMAAILFGLGYVIGEAWAQGAGGLGIAVGVAIWAVMGLISYFQGGNIMMAVSGARRIEKADHPKLFNIVEEMQIAAGMKKAPDVYIMESPTPNAFATGRHPDDSAVAVTTGLLARLNRDELQGVIAHEISHIINRDTLYMTMLGVMLGSIAMLSQVFLRGMWFTGGSMRRSRSSNNGEGAFQIVFVILAIVFSILAPIIAQMVYFAASRKREYLADASGAVLTRYPEGLASALEAISRDDTPPMAQANKITAPMYIINPLNKLSMSPLGLFSTHPPTEDRVRILRAMGGQAGATLGGYQQAWSKVSGHSQHVPVGIQGLTGGEVRPPSIPTPEATTGADALAQRRSQYREASDGVRKANDYTFLTCQCGLKVKLPPGLSPEHAACPRCRKRLLP